MPYEMLTSQLGRSRRMDLVRYRCSCLGPVLVIAVVFVGMVGSERWRAFSAADVWTVYAGMGLEVLFRPGAVSFTFGTWRLEGEACIHGVFMTVLLVAGSYSSLLGLVCDGCDVFVSWMAVSRTLVGCTKPACRYMIAELVLCGRVMPLSWVLTSLVGAHLV